ncbi:unnamed protein product [Paramecium octaurelia]|uniref:RCK N-terminal domain-containing protein n=1 Tax=Paramecium octaurelia TaxID=43137 RepID=A0A8S1YI11_PAROT|nr:unnamed protein product [Paramecium octaurelia]
MNPKMSMVIPLPQLKPENNDEYENRITLRLYIEKLLNQKVGRYLEIISGIASLASVGIYIVSTYFDSVEWLATLDIVVCSLYLTEYLLKLFAAQHRLQYIFSDFAIIELLTLFPLFTIQSVGNWNYLQRLINISRILRVFRVVRMINKLQQLSDIEYGGVTRQIYVIFSTVTTIIIVTAGVLYAFEFPKRQELIARDPNKGCSNQIDKCHFHEMIYFTIVTLSTVGYGDVIPYSEEGRVCVIVLIIIVLVVIPKQMNELIRLMGLQSVYARSFYKPNHEIPHIIICSYVSVPSLKNFCNELFHQDHGGQDKNAIILKPSIPNTEMEDFLHNERYEMFLIYLQGNPMVERDLRRAAVTQAKACVILTNKQIVDSHSADHKNILIGLLIKKYVNHLTGYNIRLCMQLIKPESKMHYKQSLGVKMITDQIIVVEEFKMNLLAKSCFCPGIISLLGNLVTSVGEQKESLDFEWLTQYTDGMGHEIYRTDLSSKFQGKTFSEVAAIVYNEFSGILFGLELDFEKQPIIRLNPGVYIISNTSKVHAYIICQDKKVADLVATYDMTTEEIANYHFSLQQNPSEKDKLNEEEDKAEDPLLSGKDQLDEQDITEKDYLLLNEPVSLMDATSIFLLEQPEINNHIVVCGIHPSIYYFLLPLRAKYLKEIQYVVILAPEKPTEIWDQINRFPKVKFVQGSPLISEDLQRASIHCADKAVIFAQSSDANKTESEDFLDQMHDAESIFIYKAIKKINPSIQIMIELVSSSNIQFLLDKDYKFQNDFKYELTPLQASGEVYISAMIDTLTCQAYYNPHIVTILQQILTGMRSSNPVIKAICEDLDIKDSNLYQVPVPEDYLNKTFGELFNYLSIERHLIPLGLYRLAKALDNKHPYVYTNPPAETTLTPRDKVFVLAHQLPADLSGIPFDANSDPKQLNTKEVENNKALNFLLEKLKQQTSSQNGVNRVAKQKNDKTVIFQGQQIKQTRNIESENMNLNLASLHVLDQVNEQISIVKEQINDIKNSLIQKEDEIVEKCRRAIRYELGTVIQQQ